MNPDPLANLRDIHLPEPISWWPLAPGWWIVILLIAVAACAVCLMLVKRHRTRLYRRQALAHLEQIEDLQGQEQLVALLELLKRTAISAYPDRSFANLNGNQLLRLLSTTCKEPIFQHIPDDLETLLYAKQISIEPVAKDFFSSAKEWIRKHPNRVQWERLPSC